MSKEEFVDYFQWLEVHFTASDEVIKAAYRRLTRRYHPDNEGSLWQSLRINEAYEVLSDPEKKRSYMEGFIRHYGNEKLLDGRGFFHSMYDFTVVPVRNCLLSYLYVIKNGAYDDAYQMLSDYNRKHLFKKDFVAWQILVAQIHELQEFDCTYEDFGVFHFSDSGYLDGRKYMKFRVRVVEWNHLMEKAEEEFFQRTLVLDKEGWHILLKLENMRQLIKKYRKITAIKNKKAIYRPTVSDCAYRSGFIPPKVFLGNCDYEQMRYLRYKTVFTLVAIWMRKGYEVGTVGEIFERALRSLDSVTWLKRGIFLILLPETNEKQGWLVAKKLRLILKGEGSAVYIVDIRCREQCYDSVKELMNNVTVKSE